MVQPILNNFTVLETVIRGLHFVLCNLLDIFAPWPRKWSSSGSTKSTDRHQRRTRKLHKTLPRLWGEARPFGPRPSQCLTSFSLRRSGPFEAFSTVAAVNRKWFFRSGSRCVRSVFSTVFDCPRRVWSSPFDRKWRHNLLPVGRKSHKRVHFRIAFSW